MQNIIFKRNSIENIVPATDHRTSLTSSPGRSYHSTGAGRSIQTLLVIIFILVTVSEYAFAQDPSLPPTNLGMANVYDGIAGKPGFVYQGFTQYFQSHNLYNASGAKVPTALKVNSLLQMNQLIYLSPVKTFGGNLGFTVLVPIVQINASILKGQSLTVNPGVIGDVIQGTAIQWSDRKFLNKSFSHRLELDVNIPVGNYNSSYQINPSSHLWAFGLYHAFTMILTDKISVSARNQINYNSNYIGQKAKAGAYYNGNYSIDYSIFKDLKVEVAAYYLTQINQDKYNGDSHYYLDQFNITNTKERVFGYGPGVAYFVKNGVLIEGKIFFETAVKNRFEGSRPTLRIAIPF